MEKFIESSHCTSRAHCETCLTSEKWRASIQRTFEWDGSCPLSEEKQKLIKDIRYNKEVLDRMENRGCKHCEKKRQEDHIDKLEDELKETQ